MAPEDTMPPKPAADVIADAVESPATGETDSPEDDEEMRRGGLPPAGFPH